MSFKDKIKSKSKGQMQGVSSLAPLALAIVSLAIIVGVGAVTLNQMTTASYTDTTVTNETFNATSDPYTYTVSVAGNADFVELQTVTVYESEAQTTEVASYNISDASAGTVNVSTTVDAGSESIDYTYSQENASTGILDTGTSALKTFADFFTVIVVIGIAAVLFLLLNVVRGAGRMTTA